MRISLRCLHEGKIKMRTGFTPSLFVNRHGHLGEKITAVLLSTSLVASFCPTTAFADAISSDPVPAESADIAPSLSNIDALSFTDMEELDTRETTIVPETLSQIAATHLMEYTEGISWGNLFSTRDSNTSNGNADTLPSEVPGTRIESLKASWRTPDDEQDNDDNRLALVPDDASNKTIQIAMEAALSGQFDYEAGDISFTIPKSFLSYRDGSPAGTMKLSVPQSPSTTGTFAYIDNGDTYSVVNTRTLPAATSILLQLEVNSIDVTRMLGDASESEHFWCDLIVKGGESGEELIGMTNNNLFATFKTISAVKSATDTVQNLYDKYPSTFPENIKPVNDGDYIYIDWYSYAHIEGNQYFDISATANLTGFPGGIILGMKDNAGKIYTAPSNVSSFTASLASDVYQTGQGYYLHTYAAYPKSGLKNDVTSTFTHAISYNLTTIDTKAASAASASASKSYTPKEWETPVGHFGIGKHGYNTYHLALNDFLKGNDQTAEFDLKTLGFGAPFTTDKYYDTNDKIPPEELGKKSYKLITDDYDTWFNNSTIPLTSNDFEFSEMRIDKPTMYNYQLFDADGRGWAENSEGNIEEMNISSGSYGYKITDDLSNQPVVIIEGVIDGSSSYTKFGQIQWQEDGSIDTQAFNGATWNNTTIIFPSNVTDTRQTAETCGHGVIYTVHPIVKIKANDNTMAQAQSLFDNSDCPETYVRNEAKVHAQVREYHYEGTTLAEGWRNTKDVVQGGDDTFKGAASGVSLSAKATVREPNTAGNPYKDRYIFNYTVQLNNQSNITDLASYNKAIEEEYIAQELQGSWFCLLPPGVHYYAASYVSKRTNDKIVNQTVVENWRNSGRDMLIIDMSQAPSPGYYNATDYMIGKAGYADRPYIAFLAEISSDDVAEFGADTRLIAAYQSNNSSIGTVKGFQGEPNDPLFGNHHESREAVGSYASEMTGLQSEYPHNENGAFVYAKDRSPISVNVSGVTGLQKSVSIDGGETWGTGQGANEMNVYGGQEYSYRLRNGATNDEKNVIIYDQLENAKGLIAGTDSKDATWRGILEEVDVSRIIAAGAVPIVYYSTSDNLDIDKNSSDRNLSDPAIWSTDKPSDMSKVTAVAIDASKSRDGGDFILKAGRSLTATLNMRAPLVTDLIEQARNAGIETSGSDWYDSAIDNTEAAEEGFNGGAHALNGTTRTSTIVGGTNQKTTTTYTKVGLKPFTIEIEKDWDDNSNHDGYRPRSIDIDIYANKNLVRTVTITDDDASANTWKKPMVRK